MPPSNRQSNLPLIPHKKKTNCDYITFSFPILFFRFVSFHFVLILSHSLTLSLSLCFYLVCLFPSLFRLPICVVVVLYMQYDFVFFFFFVCFFCLVLLFHRRIFIHFQFSILFSQVVSLKHLPPYLAGWLTGSLARSVILKHITHYIPYNILFYGHKKKSPANRKRISRKFDLI